MSTDWEKRLEQFEKSVRLLRESLAEPKTAISRNSAVMAFILAYELAWKTLKGVLMQQGIEVSTPRQALREAFRAKLLDDDPQWLETLDLRNEAIHTYNEKLADMLYQKLPGVAKKYEGLYSQLKAMLKEESK